MKKILAFILAAAMMAAVFSACSGSGSTPSDSQTSSAQASSAQTAITEATPDTSEHLTIRVAIDDMATFDDEVGQLIQEKFNVTIVPMPIESEETLGLWAAAADLPDMITTSSFEDPYRFFNWIDQSIIRDIPYEMISKYENVKNSVDTSKELNGIKDLKNGKYWYIPRKNDATTPYLVADGARIFYREDWLKNLGLSTPKTMQEFYDVLYALGHNDPTGTGAATIGEIASGGILYNIAMYGLDPESWTKEDGKWIPGYMSDRMIEPLKAVRKLYTDKTLDNEYMVTGASDMFGKWANNLGGSVIRNGGDMYWYNRMHRYVSEAMNPPLQSWQVMDKVGVLPVPVAPDGGQYWPSLIDSGAIEINAKTSDAILDRILNMVNWTLTDEAMDYYRYGVKDITYSVDENGKYVTINDPATGQPYQARFPAAYFITCANWMSAQDFVNDKMATNPNASAQSLLKQETYDWTMEYNEHRIDEGDGFYCRLISTPAKDEYYASIEYASAFNQIVAGTDTVENMFAAFKADCMSKGMQKAIDEVTKIMADIGK